MTDAAYAPLPGTIAARVLAWFADQAPEHEASSGVIADALGQPIAAVITALEPVFEHGLIAREKRDGRMYWSVGHRRLRALAGPHVNADEDDDFPIVQRVVAAAATPETPMNKPNAPTPPQPKKPRAAAPAFDPLAIELKKGRALPPAQKAASPYKLLLDRMEAGDSVDVSPEMAKGMVSVARKNNVKVVTRVLSETVTGVWRL